NFRRTFFRLATRTPSHAAIGRGKEVVMSRPNSAPTRTLPARPSPRPFAVTTIRRSSRLPCGLVSPRSNTKPTRPGVATRSSSPDESAGSRGGDRTDHLRARASGAARSFEAVRLPVLVLLQPLPVLLLRPFRRRIDGLLLPLDGLVELAQLGVGGGEGGHRRRPFRQRVGLPGGFEGLVPVADSVVRAAGAKHRQGGVIRGGVGLLSRE